MQKLLLALVLTAVTMLAGDASGNWTGNMRPAGQDTDHPVFMVLKQNGTALTGSGGPNESEQHPFEAGKAEADELSFTVEAGSGKFTFKLKMNGDEITGDVEFRRGERVETGKVTLKRAKS